MIPGWLRAHLEWDEEMRNQTVLLRVAINNLERRMGQETTDFGPLPPAPPLLLP